MQQYGICTKVMWLFSDCTYPIKMNCDSFIEIYLKCYIEAKKDKLWLKGDNNQI